MKYLIILGDGMADRPLKELQERTPLEAAKTDALNALAFKSEIGLVHTIPEGMSPGSDTANLSVLGYAPERYYTGRSPLEALSIGVDMEKTDVSFRCNFVTLSEEEGSYESQRILDHSSGELPTDDAAVLLEDVKKSLEREGYHFYLGTSYRHLLVWKEGQLLELTPPHDILTKEIGIYLPKDPVLLDMMKKSYDILKHHPINLKRKEQGLNPANSIWFWGAGTRPMLTSFEEKTGKKGVMISAVDLLKGMAVGAHMKVIQVEGANGGLHTNYTGKANAALTALLEDHYDFAYIHVEAPDEMGHQGNITDKIKAIEYLDEQVIGYIVKKLEEAKEEFRLLVLPDHPTPIEVRTHTNEPVPYLLYDSSHFVKGPGEYSEKSARESGRLWEKGDQLIDHLLCI
ncbi:MAG: cofactor-independent phosphoglycerate mutase [Lachnospiraceae bacterium]